MHFTTVNSRWPWDWWNFTSLMCSSRACMSNSHIPPTIFFSHALVRILTKFWNFNADLMIKTWKRYESRMKPKRWRNCLAPTPNALIGKTILWIHISLASWHTYSRNKLQIQILIYEVKSKDIVLHFHGMKPTIYNY